MPELSIKPQWVNLNNTHQLIKLQVVKLGKFYNQKGWVS